MKYILTVILLLFSLIFYGQGEANFWYFGQNAGLNFGTTPPSALTNGQLNTLEGCTTISDATGALLFYTDGRSVWDRNGVIMPNANYNAGNGLLGDPSSTSSALIVPQPNTPGRYFIFAVDEPHHENAATYPNQNTDFSVNEDDGFNNGFTYSVVDMNLNGGLGDVIPTEKNIPLVTYDPSSFDESSYKCSEKITAVKSDDCDAFWVITHFIDTFYAFRVDQTGVDPNPVTSQVGVEVPISGYRRNALGYMKASPEGDKIAVAHLGLATVTGGNGPGKVLLYDFDNVTGSISNEIELYDGDAPYGVEFSQSGEKLYTTIGIGSDGSGDGFLMQFDLTLPPTQIAASGTRIANENGQDITPFSAGAIQLGPDGRIYRALFNFNNGDDNYLGVLQNPEADAANVNYSDRGILVDTDGLRGSRIGLPPFIQSIFARSIDIVNSGTPNDINLNLCEGDNYTLSYQNIATATYTWFVNDVAIANTTNSLTINTTGNYRLEVDLNDGSCPLIGAANATFFEVPTVQTTPTTQQLCDSDNDGSLDLDLSSYTADILGTQDPTTFQVSYYRTLTDAVSGSNPLPQIFTTENNPQNIAIRIQNNGNPSCFDTTNFSVEIFDTPTANRVEPIIECDNADDGDDTNGAINYDLTQLNSIIYNGQDNAQFNIQYFTNQLDADNNTNPIPNPTTFLFDGNTSAVFARIQNSANPGCYDTTEIPVTINPLPQAIPSTLTQCDAFQDPNDGNTIFNLDQVYDQLTGAIPDRNLIFYESLVDAQNDINPINNTLAYANTSANQMLYVRVINNNTGCYRISTVSLAVSLTNANDIEFRECDDDGNEDGFKVFDLTLADTQILSGLNNPDLSVSYYTTLDEALAEINPITTITNTTPYTQGTDIVYARVENSSNQCFGINEVALFLYELPAIEREAIYFSCSNGPQIQLDAGLPVGVNPGDFSYSWSTGETTENITVDAPGNYSVIVTNNNTGCAEVRTVSVEISGPASISSIVIVDATTNNSVTINTEGPGDYEYTIDVDNQGILNYQDSTIFTNVPPGFHTVYIRDINGCQPIVTRNISVIGFPGYFTPNGDGIHDSWSVEGISSDVLGNSIIYIFNRQGKLLKQLSPGGNGWDGTFNGRLMPSDEYWFRVQLEDGRLSTGSFSLIR
ncbi:T9SS type B sorting domain-containing protein [Aquimarina brevivitae]|uniref:Gliding motility-associated-like protein n=1 Tax=Aquimarina brevivitae TaxID=323412 RepID=A0A4V2F7M4_9FLAO|nr:T9SS type B sorting domain-containing protein [Aquimarina brevivitae]RZT00330.1 gliding motility-associated-like protein [Aquimarina brevivitae]